MHIVSGDRRIDFRRLILNSKARDCAAAPIRPRLSAAPIVSTSPSRVRRAHRPVAPRTMARGHEGFGMPGPGRIHRRPPWASRRLGSSPAAFAKLVDNAITVIHGYPEVARLMVDLGDDKTRPSRSPGGATSGSGATPSPCPTGPAAATVSKGEARKSLGTFLQWRTDDQQTAPDRLNNKNRDAGGRDGCDG
ncbi:hypothetical protein BHMPCIPO_06478 [Ensifer sesbaniae]|nr:hypothetical protein [Ensifer sesbaniae]